MASPARWLASQQTNPLVVSLRRLTRSLGLNSWLAQRLYGTAYEQAFDTNFSSLLRQGDCVWDVGANVGHYTTQFAATVGPNGRVCAFEPSAANFQRLQEACAGLPNVTCLPLGLGATDSRFAFIQGDDPTGATSRVTTVADEGAQGAVSIRSGSFVLAAREVPPPDAIKIDVEGFEQEVLQGLGSCLGDPGLRLVGIEVHFGLLEARGLSQVPRWLEETLSAQGFTLHWTDASHLIATRSQP